MTGPIVALLMLAAAVPLWSMADRARLRLVAAGALPAGRGRSRCLTPGGRLVPARVLPVVAAMSVGVLVLALAGWPGGMAVAGLSAAAGWVAVRRLLRRRPDAADPIGQLGLAATWDLLAACLRAGLPVATAVTAVADDLPRAPAGALRATAGLLALGADPVAAWAPALDCPATAGLARSARRTARSGAALAGVAAALAASVREAAGDRAEATAQRAGVLITGPLGLCFLPAFVCLGIVPVVIGLAGQLSLHA